MKKRAPKKKKAAVKPGAAKAKKTSSAKAKRPVAKAAATVTVKATPYSPAPLKSDGWPPFRYPLT
jgi:hypothetical protein